MWGLRWEDVDLDDGELRVRQTLNPQVLYEVLREEKSPRRALEPTKTDASRRTLALPTVVVEALRQYKAQQKVASALGLVFVDERGDPIRHAHFYRRFRNLLDDVGARKITFHDGRHTAATLMLAAGVEITVVSKTLGHSAASFTADAYAHVLDELRRDAANRMDQLLR